MIETTDEETMTKEERARYDQALANALTKFGTKKDPTQNNEVVQGETLQQAELEELYRFNAYAARLVDYIPGEATRRGFVITSEDNDDKSTNPFKEDVIRLHIEKTLAKAGKLANLYGGSAIILGVNDGQKMDEPINFDKIKSLDWIYVLDRYQLAPGLLDNNPSSPGFKKPETYTVNFTDGANTEIEEKNQANINTGDIIHASRMIRFYGVELPDDCRAQEDYWGDSIIQRAFTAMGNMVMTESAIGTITQRFQNKILKIKGLAEILKGKNGAELLDKRIESLLLSDSILGAWLMDADKEDFSLVTSNVTGLSDLYDRMAQSWTGATGFPMTVFFGTTPGGMSTDDESAQRNINNKTRTVQTNVYIPAYETILNIIALSADGPGVKSFTVTAIPLVEPSEMETAETAKIWIEGVALLIDRGVLSANEVRNSWFGPDSEGFTMSFVLEEAPPEPEPAKDPDVFLDMDEQELLEAATAAGVEPDELLASIVASDLHAMTTRVPQEDAGYCRGTQGKTCDRCIHFKSGGCDMVLGKIHEDATCRFFK